MPLIASPLSTSLASARFTSRVSCFSDKALCRVCRCPKGQQQRSRRKRNHSNSTNLRGTCPLLASAGDSAVTMISTAASSMITQQAQAQTSGLAAASVAANATVLVAAAAACAIAAAAAAIFVLHRDPASMLRDARFAITGRRGRLAHAASTKKSQWTSNAWDNKTVWVVGASQGLGYVVAYELARRGARLILSSRNRAKLEAVKSGLPNPNVHVVVPVDVTDEPSVVSAVRAVKHSVKETVSCVALCVGRSQRAPADETSLAVDRAAMEVNFHGPVCVAKHAMSLLRASPPGGSPAGGRERGRFLVICSLAGTVPSPAQVSYCAAKHALRAWFETLRAEMHPSRDGVGVTVCCPGPAGGAPRSVFGAVLEADADGAEQHSRAPASMSETDVPGVSVVSSPDDKASVKSVDGKKEKRLDPLWVAQVCVDATEAGANEALLAPPPLLGFALLYRFVPFVANLALRLKGPKRIAACRSGASLYEGLTN